MFIIEQTQCMLSNASINKQLFSSPFLHVSRCEATMAEKNKNNFLKRSQNTRRRVYFSLLACNLTLFCHCSLSSAWRGRRKLKQTHDAVKRFVQEEVFIRNTFPLKLIQPLWLFLSPVSRLKQCRMCKYFN